MRSSRRRLRALPISLCSAPSVSSAFDPEPTLRAVRARRWKGRSARRSAEASSLSMSLTMPMNLRKNCSIPSRSTPPPTEAGSAVSMRSSSRRRGGSTGDRSRPGAPSVRRPRACRQAVRRASRTATSRRSACPCARSRRGSSPAGSGLRPGPRPVQPQRPAWQTGSAVSSRPPVDRTMSGMRLQCDQNAKPRARSPFPAAAIRL